jgi:H+-transporting ATPase
MRQRLTINARVRRDGSWRVLPAAEIVPDDIVHLRVGDIVPADVGVIEGNVSVDQSQLTGESLPVEHRVGSTIYAGSLVRRGEATGLVSATATRTYFGKTAELVRTAEAPARAEILIVGITKYLAALGILLAVAVVVVIVIRGASLLDSLPFVLMLLVASAACSADDVHDACGAWCARAREQWNPCHTSLGNSGRGGDGYALYRQDRNAPCE